MTLVTHLWYIVLVYLKYNYSIWFIIPLLIVSCSQDEPQAISEFPKIEKFTFISNGVDINGKIFLPESFKTNKTLPTIYLIDYQEQHFKVATDEFEQVIKGVQQIPNFDALVVTLFDHENIDSKPSEFQTYYNVFKDMSSYVDGVYTDNLSRTFIGRGSEAGIVFLTLFMEDPLTTVFNNFIVTDSPSSFNSIISNSIANNDIPEIVSDKKLHFSFSLDNDRNQCVALIDQINNEQFPWLQFKSFEYTDLGYENTYPHSFAAGLEFLFAQ